MNYTSVLLNERRNAGNFLPPRLAARPGHNRKFIEHHRRIFQKAAIRTIVGGWDLKNIDSQASQQLPVLLVLLHGTVEVDWLTINEGKFAFGDTRRNSAGEGSQHFARS